MPVGARYRAGQPSSDSLSHERLRQTGRRPLSAHQPGHGDQRQHVGQHDQQRVRQFDAEGRQLAYYSKAHGHTLSRIFAADLAAPAWQRAQANDVHRMLAQFLAP